MSEINMIIKNKLETKDFVEIKRLMDICQSQEKVNLKLELEYKQYVTEQASDFAHEFLYYMDNDLISYLGICGFGGNTLEINGMTHPEWRRKGIFTKLFTAACSTGKERKGKFLLLTDHLSESGTFFIKHVGGKYSVSEYRMILENFQSPNLNSYVNLREAKDEDHLTILKLDNELFDEEDNIDFSGLVDIVNNPNEITYMIEVEQNVIGKIRVEIEDGKAFIYGFGLMPEFRGKGHGKAALSEAIKGILALGITNIQLDVACNNETALNLYTSLGFKQISVMDYYEY